MKPRFNAALILTPLAAALVNYAGQRSIKLQQPESFELLEGAAARRQVQERLQWQ